MKRTLILLTVAAVTLTAMILAQQPPADNPIPPSRAKVYVDEMEFDFGYLPNDAFVGHIYKLHSRGQDSLKILRVKPACGCTKAPLQKEVIAPGDSAEVELIFHAAKNQRGRADKTAAITCNDNEKQTFNLRFRGIMYPTDRPDSLRPVTLSQSQVKWMYGTPAQEAVIAVANVSGTPVRLQMIAAPAGFAVVDLPKDEIKPGKKRDIRVRLDKAFAGKDFQKSFTFECNDAARTRITVPVLLDAPISAVAPQIAPASGTGNSANDKPAGSTR